MIQITDVKYTMRLFSGVDLRPSTVWLNWLGCRFNYSIVLIGRIYCKFYFNNLKSIYNKYR